MVGSKDGGELFVLFLPFLPSYLFPSPFFLFLLLNLCSSLLSLKPLKWTRKTYGNHFDWKPTLNFSLIASDILNALDFSLGTEATTDATCRYSQVPLLRNTLFCQCMDGIYNKVSQLKPSYLLFSSVYSYETLFQTIGDLSSSACTPYEFTNSNYAPSSPQAVIYVCDDEKTDISQLGFQLEFEKETTASGCDVVYVDLVPVYQFEKPTEIRISSSIIPMPSYKEFSVVYNENGYIIGQLLGNGLEIEHNKPLKNVKLCFTVTLEQEEKEYDVVDLGRKRSDGSFFPLGLIGTKEDSGSVCVIIPRLEPCEELDSCSILPILRQKDYKSIDNYYETWERLARLASSIFPCLL
jgi:hypothetical protein